VAPPSSPPAPSRLEVIAAGEGAGTCNVDVDRSVEVVSLPTWTALWHHLVRTRRPPPGGEPLRRPVDDAGVREALQVGDCTRACTLIWPPVGPGDPAAYLVVAGPRGGLQLYDPRVESSGTGTCNGGPPGASVKGLAPVVHATFTIEASASTRVCLADGGELVPEGEGTEDLQCMSACVSRDWKEVDLFVGAGGRPVRVARMGKRDMAGKERIAALSREGSALVVRGEGCTRRLPLDVDGGG
jgi:hypothetical protein